MQPMRLNALAHKIGVIVARWLRRLPDCPRLARGLGFELGFLSFTLAAHGFYFRPVRPFLFRGQLATNVRPPLFGQPAAPVTESPGGDAVTVENVPASGIASFTVGCKAVQQSVRMDIVWWL